MISIELVRKDRNYVEQALLKREVKVDLSDVVEYDKEKRDLLSKADALKAHKNKVSSSIVIYKKEGKDTQPIFDEMKKIGEEIAVIDERIAELTEKINDVMYALPNIPDEDLLPGGKENNKVIEVSGEKPEFAFKPLSHIDICKKNGFIDYERGAKLAGNGSWIYRGEGAELEWALLNFFIQQHIADGYEFVLPPHMLGYECGFTAGQFPKFDEEVYWIDSKSKTSKFLLPTAETALVNLYRDEIIPEEKLPMKLFAYTPCYRREAGSYRAEERGMIRGHQFNKVEMFQFTKPEDSDKAFEELVNKAADIPRKLGLHFQVSKLAAGDCSSGMARTYDIEIWIPSMGIYKEISSASNARDYQARRGNMRYKNKETGKTELIHTLNASGLATSRLFPAILEQYQNEDGTVTVPEALRPFMNGKTVIGNK